MFSQTPMRESTKSCSEPIERLKHMLDSADAILIGAGSGLSTSAGFYYDGGRFMRYFSDFHEKYGIADMYAGGFYPFPTLNEYWAWWSRHIYVNRYMNAPKPVYDRLYELVKDKDYFVLTTNVDHCFQKAGFDKRRLFYTQGDYGLLQCSRPCQRKVYDNADIIRRMILAQGYEIAPDNELILPDGVTPLTAIPSELIPYCPECGQPLTTNLRIDGTFVEDDGWRSASERYAGFLEEHRSGRLLLLETGVGFNTPGIIKYSFWCIAQAQKNAMYACLNKGEAYAPDEIGERSVCVNGDIGEILSWL